MKKSELKSIIKEILTEDKNLRQIKSWRSSQWKTWAKQSNFPFNTPREKAIDMAHDGYSYKEAIKSIKKVFPGMTEEDIDSVWMEFD